MKDPKEVLRELHSYIVKLGEENEQSAAELVANLKEGSSQSEIEEVNKEILKKRGTSSACLKISKKLIESYKNL